MANLTRLFPIGQKVKYMDKEPWETKPRMYKGIVVESYEDHVIVDVPQISDHMWFEEGFNLEQLYIDYGES